jgi:hypothetical protein
MIEQRKSLTVFFNLKAQGCLPFPGLDNLGQQLIPVYDIQDTMLIDKSKFVNTFGFVQNTLTSRKNITIAFIVLASIFLFVGIIGLIYFL